MATLARECEESGKSLPSQARSRPNCSFTSTMRSSTVVLIATLAFVALSGVNGAFVSTSAFSVRTLKAHTIELQFESAGSPTPNFLNHFSAHPLLLPTLRLLLQELHKQSYTLCAFRTSFLSTVTLTPSSCIISACSLVSPPLALARTMESLTVVR